LSGAIISSLTLSGAIINSGVSLVGIAGIPSLAPIDAYEGSYEITPAVDAQVMDTLDKRMTDNVQILAIPFHEVSNTDGLTVIIGG
jgi:hypothetical protein